MVMMLSWPIKIAMIFHYNGAAAAEQIKKRITPAQQSILSKQGLKNAKDFLLLRPNQYLKRLAHVTIDALPIGQMRAIVGRLQGVSRRVVRKNLTVFSAQLLTENDAIYVTWFNQKYIADQLNRYPYVVAFGKRESNHFDATFQVSSFETYPTLESTGHGQILPVYPDFKGVSSKTLLLLIRALIQHTNVVDMLPKQVCASEGLVDIQTALQGFHFPTSEQCVAQAIKRFSFDELFLYMHPRRLANQRVKQTLGHFHLKPQHALIKRYMSQLPYQLTGAQQRIWDHLCHDFDTNQLVFRLIQGDVGSGKTDIATLALLAAVASGYQGALLVPTEILSQQHYFKLSERLKDLGISVHLLKGKQAKKERQLVLSALASNQPLIVVGTHALVQESVIFSNLAMVVIDEQHRFGVFQRQLLLEKAKKPHCLFMTATPIPRTLMLTHYGDLDHDTIDEMPPGRFPIKTYFGQPNRIRQVHEFIRLTLNNGGQAYVVYPLIESSEHLSDIQPAIDGFNECIMTFSEFTVGLLHGKMPNKDKQHVMQQFKSNHIQLLVSTTVVEVGVDVPNATIMVIMHAERFGLSQLHQLRGRVGRGGDQSHCFLIAQPKSEPSRQRINAMLSSTNGFKLAEEDLKIRGPGHLLGTQQSGDLVFSFANAANQALMQRVVFWCDRVIQKSSEQSQLQSFLLNQCVVASELLN
jgi:ATP-dependent DNA helicase RecG